MQQKKQIPHPLGHKKVPKPLVIPINAPYFPGVGGGGVGVSIDRCISLQQKHLPSSYGKIAYLASKLQSHSFRLCGICSPSKHKLILAHRPEEVAKHWPVLSRHY